MLNKIYLALLAAAFFVMAFFAFYSWSWLQSIGSPLAVVENFNFHSELSWIFLWISAVVLLVVGNAILWIHRKSWAMWITCVYFALFVLIKYLWLDQAFFAFKRTNNLLEGGFNFGPFSAIFLCLIAVGIVFFDQFIVSRLAEKMHPTTVPETDGPIIPETESKS